MDKQTRSRRSFVAGKLKPWYKRENKLSSGKGISDEKLFQWFFEKKNLTFDRSLQKNQVIDFIYLTLKKVVVEPPSGGSNPKKDTVEITESNYRGFYDTLDWKWLKTKILRLYGTKCMKCGITNVEMHVDHIKPRSKHIELQLAPTNLQVLCRGCNMEKSNKNETDYRTQQDKEKLIKFLMKK